MKAFVGFLIMMEILCRICSYHDWRCTDKQKSVYFRLQVAIYSVMSQIPFELIWQFLHLADNSQDNRADKLFKVQHFVDLTTTQFFNYTLHKPATTDEAVIPYKGKFSFKQ